MKRAIPTTLAAVALALAAGCGSSAKTAKTATTAARRLRSGGIKADTTPNFVSPSKSAPVESGRVAIAYRNIAIDPDTVRVKVGSTIEWTNYDTVEHNVTSAGGPQRFASKRFGEGGTFTIRATKPGLIRYECTIHPTTMNGTIEVVG
jgi:plastocyanin